MALLKSKELGLIEYEGFAHMDYAKSIYNKDMRNHRLHKKNEYDMWMLQNEQQYKEPEQELEYKPLISVVVLSI